MPDALNKPERTHVARCDRLPCVGGRSSFAVGKKLALAGYADAQEARASGRARDQGLDEANA